MRGRKRKYSDDDIKLMCSITTDEAKRIFGITSGTLSHTKARYGGRITGSLNGSIFIKKPWGEEEIKLLGKISDAEHAKLFERSKKSVNLKRFSLGIPAKIENQMRPGRKRKSAIP